MIVQKSYTASSKLYLVPTPIGNMQDMTYRAVDALRESDVIFCEDTRVTKVLLSHFAIQSDLRSYHIFNENERIDEILNLLRAGKTISLVSDAGMPCISDPGYLISVKAIEEGFACIALPGANAGLTALVASGLPTNQFFFFGFLDHKASQKEKQLSKIKQMTQTIIFYESPYRVLETLKIMHKVLGDRNVVVAREISKKFEEYTRGKLSELIENPPMAKGEFVIIVSGAKEQEESLELNQLSVEEHMKHYLDQGIDEKEAMRKVAKDRGVAKGEIYKIIKT